MPEPNPILGVHVVPGGLAWARVRREADGSFRVLTWGTEETPGDTVPSLEAAAGVLGRRAFRGRGSFVALPDVAGCLVTAVIPADELHLEGDDLHRELYESTPFEPDAAALRLRLLRAEGRKREFLVAAVPIAREQQETAALGKRADESVGLGFATACTFRGARALGLAPRDGFLVEVASRVTVVTALDGTRARRYLVAAGRDDSGPHRLALAGDVVSVADYHRALAFAPNHPPDDLPPPVLVGVGVALSDPSLRSSLATTLGEAFARTDARFEPECRIVWDDAPGAALPALAGAVGAALEAFAPEAERLALRPLPAELPELPRRPGWLVAAGVLGGLAIVAAGAGLWWPPGNGRSTGDRPTAAQDTPRTDDPAVRARAGHVAAWRDALASIAHVVGEPGPSDRALRRAVVESADGGWSVEAEVRVRGGGPAVDEAARDLGARTPVPGEGVPAVRVDRTPVPGTLRLHWRVPIAAAAGTGDELTRLSQALAQLSQRRTQSGPAADGTVAARDALAHAALHCGDEPPRRIELTAASDARVRLATTGAATPPAPEPRRAARPAREVEKSLYGGIPSAPFIADDDPDPGLTVQVAAAGPGEVRVSAPAAWRARTLQRRGPEADAPWADVAVFGAEAIEMRDEVPGRSGVWEWRLRTADAGPQEAASVHVEVPVEVELLGRGRAGAARLALTRVFAGTQHRVVAEVRPGEAVTATSPASRDGPALTFAPGETLAALREEILREKTRERLPTYLPDGRVRRGPDGAPQYEERDVERPVRVLEALLRAPGGAERAVSRKMTDG